MEQFWNWVAYDPVGKPLSVAVFLFIILGLAFLYAWSEERRRNRPMTRQQRLDAAWRIYLNQEGRGLRSEAEERRRFGWWLAHYHPDLKGGEYEV